MGEDSIILENGGIVYSSSNVEYVIDSPHIYESDDDDDDIFLFTITQMVKSSSSDLDGISGGGKFKIYTESTGNAMSKDEAQGKNKAYGFRVQFYGDNKGAWIDLFKDFDFQDESDSTLLYMNDGVRLMLWHSFITFRISI